VPLHLGERRRLTSVRRVKKSAQSSVRNRSFNHKHFETIPAQLLGRDSPVTNAAQAIGMLSGHGDTISSRLTSVVKSVSHTAPRLSPRSDPDRTTYKRKQPLTPLQLQQPVHPPADVLAQHSAVALRSTVEQHAREMIQDNMLEDTFWIVDLGTVQKLKQDWDARCVC
jgi:hypothetical protein